ncbi:Uncharacterized protein OBRU01_07372 [Operophtera brumata]|uniref:Uncharacterized protein n=1 Tax=Operophtera brumata TaxID=104452 RepID=A0A0L7LEE4_OPEBR|nr:Uncharacterized protein OBRU01_07372 [Operophtera brumata]
MSLKSIECVVRELQLTVVSLVNKVELLECKISEQSAIIIKLSSLSDEISTRKSLASAPSTRTPGTSVASRGNAAVPQRTVRRAHIQASAAITEQFSAARKRSDVRADTMIPPKNDAAPTGCPKPSSAKQMALLRDYPAGTPNSAVIVSSDSLKVTDDDQTKNEWQVVSRQRRHKQQRPVVITGTSKDSDDLQSADRLKHIQAWCFKPDTTTESLLKFLNKITEADYTVEKRNIKTDRHASFIIGMPENVYDEVTSPTAWPAGISFSEWFLFRPRSLRGSERAD